VNKAGVLRFGPRSYSQRVPRGGLRGHPSPTTAACFGTFRQVHHKRGGRDTGLPTPGPGVGGDVGKVARPNNGRLGKGAGGRGRSRGAPGGDPGECFCIPAYFRAKNFRQKKRKRGTPGEGGTEWSIRTRNILLFFGNMAPPCFFIRQITGPGPPHLGDDGPPGTRACPIYHPYPTCPPSRFAGQQNTKSGLGPT